MFKQSNLYHRNLHDVVQLLHLISAQGNSLTAQMHIAHEGVEGIVGQLAFYLHLQIGQILFAVTQAPVDKLNRFNYNRGIIEMLTPELYQAEGPFSLAYIRMAIKRCQHLWEIEDCIARFLQSFLNLEIRLAIQVHGFHIAHALRITAAEKHQVSWEVLPILHLKQPHPTFWVCGRSLTTGRLALQVASVVALRI